MRRQTPSTRRRRFASVVTLMSAAAAAGCGVEPLDSMTLVMSEPRLTIANCLESKADGLPVPGRSTFVDAMDALRADAPNEAARISRRLEVAGRELRGQAYRDEVRVIAAEVRSSAAEDRAVPPVGGAGGVEGGAVDSGEPPAE